MVDLENLYVRCPGCGGSLIILCDRSRHGIHGVLPFAVHDGDLNLEVNRVADMPEPSHLQPYLAEIAEQFILTGVRVQACQVEGEAELVLRVTGRRGGKEGFAAQIALIQALLLEERSSSRSHT